MIYLFLKAQSNWLGSGDEIELFSVPEELIRQIEVELSTQAKKVPMPTREIQILDTVWPALAQEYQDVLQVK